MQIYATLAQTTSTLCTIVLNTAVQPRIPKMWDDYAAIYSAQSVRTRRITRLTPASRSCFLHLRRFQFLASSSTVSRVITDRSHVSPNVARLYTTVYDFLLHYRETFLQPNFNFSTFFTIPISTAQSI